MRVFWTGENLSRTDLMFLCELSVGMETLTGLGNSRATAAVTLLLLLLYSALQARTRVPSPILYLSVGHRTMVTA